MTEYKWAPAPEQQRSADDIPNAPFWPALNMVDFCDQYAITGALDNAMIKNALTIAATKTNARLRTYMEKALSQGQSEFVTWGTTGDGAAIVVDLNDPDALDQVPADTVANNSVLITLYHQAVYCAAMADLLGRSPLQTDDDRASLISHYNTQSTDAIAELNGERATGVYLI